MPTTNPFSSGDLVQALDHRYVLGNELRVGGQGVVYRATRVRDSDGIQRNNDVALKIHLDSIHDQRVEREIAASKNLRHPSLATLLEDGSIVIVGKLIRYIAWEFIEGEPLDARLKRGPLTQSDAVRVARDVTLAIAAIWARHIVHRDITPKNIMIRSDGSAVPIDLGGARYIDNTTITAPGLTFGTVGYFSPEQFRAEHGLTSSSDVFTLGVVLFECLLGRHPTGLDQYTLAMTPPSAASLLPQVRPELRNLLDAMLRLRASFRPTLSVLQSAFEELMN